MYRELIKKYGEENQKRIAQEELAELIQAISKDLRGLKHNVEEEIADVIIMLDQLMLMYDNQIVMGYVGYKKNRLKEMIKENED